MSDLKLIVGFDQAHKPRGRIDSNYTEMRDLLNQNGFICQPFEAYPITLQSLEQIDILVFVCPDFSKVSKNEIDAIKVWVKEKGGGLLLLNHAGGDKGRRSNLSEVGQQFGIIFENDQCLDSYNNIGVENLPVINNFGFPHPINEGLEEICYRAGCTLTLAGPNTIPIISSGPTSEPPETPLCLASESGEGRVVGIGSYEMFRDNTNGGIDFGSHKQLVLNMFNWLRTSKREQIRAKFGVSQSSLGMEQIASGAEVDIGSPERSGQTTVSGSSPSSGVLGARPVIEYTSNVKILAKKELLQAFEDQLAALYEFKEKMLREFEALQKSTENLIRAVIATEEDMVLIRQPEEEATVDEGAQAEQEEENPLASVLASLNRLEEEKKKDLEQSASSVESQTPSFNPPPNLNPPPGVSSGSNSSLSSEQNQVPPLTGVEDFELTPLPPKPSAVSQQAYGDYGQEDYNQQYGSGAYDQYSQTPTDETLEGYSDYSQMAYQDSVAQEQNESTVESSVAEQNEEVVEEPKEKPSQGLVISEDELKQELEGLQKKLNSISNLRRFLDKKFEAGKMTREKYEKQLKKLENDKNKAKFRIEEIEAILKKK